jgi:hypothetical protein
MKMNRILVFALSILMVSCNPYKISSYTSVKNTSDGQELVENNKEYISIKYYGDYWFHQLRKNITYNWDDNVMNLIKTKKNKIIMYCGHTIVDPYFSTIGLVYKDSQLAQTIDEITPKLKKLRAQNLTTTNAQIGRFNFTKLYYELYDPELKIERRYYDYYCTHENDVLRILFWTSEYNHNILEDESKEIIETLQNI